MAKNHLALVLTSCLSTFSLVAQAEEVVLEQIVSREHPDFDAAQAMLSLGKDGQVYLGSNGSGQAAYVLRAKVDGSERFGGSVTYALNGVAANRVGILATANGHFAHKIGLYNAKFQSQTDVTDFLVGDAVGYDAPGHVEVGASGDFYGLDKHRDRILRISPQGKVLRAYPIPREPAGNAGLVDNFRVCEQLERFYLLPRQGALRAVDFSGKLLWTTPTRVSVSHLGLHGGYDVDEDGNLHVLQERSNKVVIIKPSGESAGEVVLDISDFSPRADGRAGTISGLRVAKDEFLLKRWDPTRLFERYDLRTGRFLGSVASQHERLKVTYPSHVWRAGESHDFKIGYSGPDKKTSPQWRVWIRAMHEAAWRELKLASGRLEVPGDLGGVCQIKVTPEVEPRERGEPSEYGVRGWIEVRAPKAGGSLTIFTPNNRAFYAQGDPIPLSLLARSSETKPLEATVELAAGRELVASSRLSIVPGTVQSITLPEALTRALRPGTYRLRAAAEGITSVPFTLVIGEPECSPGFLRMRYGDYGPTYPQAKPGNAADIVAAHVERERKLGFNTFVDRIGTHTQIGALRWDGAGQAELNQLAQKLEADPIAAAPQSAQMVSPLEQVMAAYSAHGMQQMAILLYMDAGLPLGGPGFDHRKPEKMVEDLQTVTKSLLPYSSFRGWSWHANWWIFDQRGSAAATSPEQKAAYEAALKKAKETGGWSQVLDDVSDRRLGFAPEAQAYFGKGLREIDGSRRLMTASAGTYRNVESYPPISFRNIDEVDLQGQFEQIFLPYFPVHAVDFYRRPGKPVWGHPEIWNDAGTGEQILPELFSMLMRSPDGLGPSGSVPPWTSQTGMKADPRIAHFGTSSVFRAFNRLAERYGPWITTLENDDQVAIVASARPFKIDEWGQVMGVHFSRLMEAYVSCLHAHHPASIVFAEDLQPDTLKRYKAVLVVDQWVEMEPAGVTALTKAHEAGVQVFYDGTCRESLMKGFTPLGIAFNKFEKDKHPASDDAAYYRFPRYVQQNLPVLKAALDKTVAPAARIQNPEVWISQLKSEESRYLFVVNNSSLPLEPSQMWRTTLFVASTLPVVEPVELTRSAPAVYDVFAMKEVTPSTPKLEADLRDLPARLYALLPAAIEAVQLSGPQQVAAGQPLEWKASACDKAGKPIAGNVPLRLRLLSADNQSVQEAYATATSQGARGTLVAPLRSVGDSLKLEVTELFSGKRTRLEVKLTKSKSPISLTDPQIVATTATAAAVGKAIESVGEATEGEFGPHLRDVVVSPDGKTALLSAMNWDHNLIGLDVDSGRVNWRKKIGNYFAFAPQSNELGFTVQGFDYSSAEGYHLYRLDNEGRLGRRFALFGLPRRLPHRFVPGLLGDREQPVNNFALPASGAWVATAADLGLAVWQSDGKLLWKQEWTADRQPALLAPLGSSTLLVAKNMSLVAHSAATGEIQWKQELAATGMVRKLVTSRDGTTAAVLATTNGGRLFLLREGKVAAVFPAPGDDLDISTDGEVVVVVNKNQLRYFTLSEGFRWFFSGDDSLRNARLSANGARVAVASELGSLYVLDSQGKPLHESDLQALASPAWLPQGDLLVATWMGKVQRLDKDFRSVWEAILRSSSNDVLASLTRSEDLVTSRISDWGNAEKEPLALAPNLLKEAKALVRFVATGVPHVGLARPADALIDGDPTPPADPWLEWGDVNGLAEANPETYLELDTFRTQLAVTAITFVEDSQRPDSWLRDASFEYWSAEDERWLPVQSLLSDAATHTHVFQRPVEAAKFRVLIPKGFFRNLRCGEIVLHGKTLGASHPDVIAKRSVATLFDESEAFKGIYPYHDRWSFQLQDAASGGRFLQVNANQMIAPTFYPTFGHTVPTWDFEIAEEPQPGQYRWVQWSWKALSPETKGATLQLGNLRLHAGAASGEDYIPAHKTADAVPSEWQTVRFDLWKVLKKPARIQTLYLGASGGAVGFDRVLLGRSEADLEKAAADRR